jgi:hypothetical protein
MHYKERTTRTYCHWRTTNIEALREKQRLFSRIYLSLMLVAVTTSPTAGWSLSFTVPADVALRISLDDTLASTDSQVGDPFSATVVDEGKYRNARGGHTDAALRSTGYAGPPPRPHPRRAGRALRCTVRGRKSTSKARSNLGEEIEPALFTPRLERGRSAA